MMRKAWIVLPILALPSQVFAAETLLPDRLGPVRLGMTLAAAARSLGSGIVAETDSRERCWYGRRADGVDPGVGYMIESGAVARIDIVSPRDGKAPAVATRRGIRIGSTRGEVVRAYGGRVRFDPHPLSPHAQWAKVEAGSRGGIRLQLADGKVVSFWAGRGRALDYPEGCS